MISLMLLLLTCIPREAPPEKVLNLIQISVLPERLNENSGMIESGDLIWFMNDSGNEPVLYGFSRTQDTVVREVVVRNTMNTDWEDITQNEDYIFIGDFGNNDGSRTDLRIIRIDKQDLLTDADTISPSGVIEFSYEDQADFTPANQMTNFDCEAFIATEDTLVLFTKDWVDNKTRLYTIPALPGLYTASFRKEWEVSGLITSAAWSENADELFLLGYTLTLSPFLWIYSGFDAGNLSYDTGERTDFTEYQGTQTEGILISTNGQLLISSENMVTLNIPAGLFMVEER